MATLLELVEKEQDSDKVKYHLEINGNTDLDLRDRVDSQTPLHIAAKLGLVEIGKILLNFGADPNVLDRHGWTPLHCAASKGELDFCSLLLDNGGNPTLTNRNDSTPFHYLVRLEFSSSSFLWAQNYLLIQARREGWGGREKEESDAFLFSPSSPLISSLSSLSAPSPSPSSPSSPSSSSSPSSPSSMLKKEMSISSSEELKEIIHKTSREERKKEEGEGGKEGGDESLSTSTSATDFYVGKEGREEEEEEEGKESEKRPPSSQFGDEINRLVKFYEILDKIYKMDFILDAQNESGETPLHCACIHARPHSVEWLCARGSDINIQKKRGLTPLHLSIQKEDFLSIKILLSYGADVGVISQEGGNAIHLALKLGKMEVLKLLMREGKLNGPRNLIASARRLRHANSFITRKIRLKNEVVEEGGEEGGKLVVKRPFSPSTVSPLPSPLPSPSLSVSPSFSASNSLSASNSNALSVSTSGSSFSSSFLSPSLSVSPSPSPSLSTSGFPSPSPFSLPREGKKKGGRALDTMFALYTCCTGSRPSKYPFYVSEMVYDSVNPDWRDIDHVKLSENVFLPKHFIDNSMDIYFRLFARPTDVYRTLPATRHPQFCQSHFALDEVEEEGGEEGGKGEVGGAVDERVLGVMRTMEVVMERKISLKNLGYVGNLETVSPFFPTNALFLELSDGIYTTPDVIKKMTDNERFPFEEVASSLRGAPVVSRGGGGEKVSSLKLVDIVQFVEAHSALKQQRTEQTAKSAQLVTQKLEENKKLLQMRSRRAVLQLRIERLKKKLNDIQEHGEEEKEQLKEAQQNLLPRAKDIRKSQIALIARKKRLQEERKAYEMDDVRYKEVGRNIALRQKYLLQELQGVYPIRLSRDFVTVGDAELQFLRARDYSGLDEESVATALGFICHMTQLISRWFQVPLRYAVKPMGSRSTIYDHVSQPTPLPYPLYSRGGVRKELKEAKYLLKHDIAQLLNARGIRSRKYLCQNMLALLNTEESLKLLQLLERYEGGGRERGTERDRETGGR